MCRTTVASLGVLVIASAIWAVLHLTQELTSTGEVATIRAPVRSADVRAYEPADLPVLAGDSSTRPLVLDTPDAGGEMGAAESASRDPAPLRVTVVHALGWPASGGRAALYDADQQLVAQGVLDIEGRWECAGVDGPVEFFVLGLTPDPARAQWPSGQGDHEVTLPGGAALQGQVLVNGVSPGRPFPLSLSSDWGGAHALFQEHTEQPRGAHLPGEIASCLRGGFLTDADGRFLVSGLAAGTQVSLAWPRFYTTDESAPAPFPVTVPAAGVVLSLTRPHMIRGRILTADSQPAADARLTVKVSYTQESPSRKGGSPIQAGSSSLTFNDSAVAEDGRFAIAIGNPFAPQTDNPEPPALPPRIGMSVDLLARDPAGNWVRAALPDGDWMRDHDLGDLALQPVRRVVLEVVDPLGLPIVSARVRPEVATTDAPSAMLLTDDRGAVEIDLTVATLGWVTIVAEGFLTETVELPPDPPTAPQLVTLSPAASLTLRLRGPWEDDPSTSADWQFEFCVVAVDSAYHDAVLPVPPGQQARQGPDPMRLRPESFTGTSGSSIYGDGRVEHSFYSQLPEWRFDGLRAHHGLSFRIFVSHVPEWFGIAPGDVVWETSDVWLEVGEQRKLVADLNHLQPGD